MSFDLFCNNCGKGGHVFHLCKMPITSIGIIAFRITPEKQKELLMICRKDSLGYVDFMRGKFSLYQKQYIMNMIKQMTISEKKLLLKKNDIHEEKGDDRIVSLMKGIHHNDEYYDLKSLILECDTDWMEPEWGFPKGRRNSGETDYDCALREFSEETGYPNYILHNINNLIPMEEIFTGSNHNSYRHKYYVMYLPYEDSLFSNNDFQKSEISNMKWMNMDQCLEMIRPYNLEKKKVVSNLFKCLQSVQFIRI
jgi:8-oxo-dGTP pyrophosphatase MutT (NUDIX family)